MRILFLANNGEGLYKFRKELLETLLKDNEVFISLPRDKYIPLLEELGCKYIETEFERKGTNPLKDLELLDLYKQILNDVKPNVVLTYTIKPNVYGGLACSKLNVPYIVNITGLGSALENPGILQLITSNLYKKGLKQASKVFFQNNMNQEFMLSKNIVAKDQCILIPGSGVNTKQYELMEYPNKDTIDFAYIGRIMTEKGFGLYLDAAKAIKKKYPKAMFHIAGEYEDDYKEQVENAIENNIVIYHGSVVDMKNEIYKNINCTVAPTYYPEGMSNVLLESLACGRPIITTDRPGCKEIVEDGINGYIVKQRDLNDLITKIEIFINLPADKQKELGNNGRLKIEKEFDRSIVINKYLEEIKKCV